MSFTPSEFTPAIVNRTNRQAESAILGIPVNAVKTMVSKTSFCLFEGELEPCERCEDSLVEFDHNTVGLKDIYHSIKASCNMYQANGTG